MDTDQNKQPSTEDYKHRLRLEIGESVYSTFCADVRRERQRQISKFGLQSVPVCSAPPGDTAHVAAWYGLAPTPELRAAVVPHAEPAAQLVDAGGEE